MHHRTSKYDSREVEVSPDGRYVRFEEKLGSGAYKEVFLCYDTETGKEVAWNTVNLSRLPLHERKRIISETEILASLHHPHIINFYHVWENPNNDQICFTTEIVTSGTLKEYTSRVKNIKLKVIKKWCRQILAGLDYLHSHHPPIIHRDLKCDNIFINGSTGEVRIGDFGLSVARHATHVESVLGTPEFMSMELYDENYTELVDIYAFGMCVLEMITKEYPYEECNNAAQIWKKVSSGQKPEVLSRIRDPQVKLFVELCLSSATLRLSARELLQHPFLAFKRSHPGRDNIVVTVEHRVLKGEKEKEREREREKEKEERKERTERELREREREREREQQQRDRVSLYGNGSTSSSSSSQQQSLSSRPNSIIQVAPSHRTPSVNNIHVNTSISPQASPPSTPALLQHSASHPNLSAAHMTGAAAGQGRGQQQHMMTGYSHHPQQQQHVHAPVPVKHTYPSMTPSSSSLQPQQSSSQRGGPSSSPQPPQQPSLHHQVPHLTRSASPGGGSSNIPASTSSSSLSTSLPSPLTPAPSSDPPIISLVQVDIESTHHHIAHIILHLHFENRKKKQIKFDFDFRHDTSTSIASELVKAVKLSHNDRASTLIAHSIESKVEPYRKQYFDQMRMESNSSSITPHSSGSQQQSSQYHHPPPPPHHHSSSTQMHPPASIPHSTSNPHLQHHHHHHTPSIGHGINNNTMPLQSSSVMKRATTSQHPHAATLPSHHSSYQQPPNLHSSQSGNHLVAGSPSMPSSSSSTMSGHRREHSVPPAAIQGQPLQHSHGQQSSGSRSSTPHTSGHHAKLQPSMNTTPQLSSHPHPLLKTASAGNIPASMQSHHHHSHSMSQSHSHIHSHTQSHPHHSHSISSSSPSSHMVSPIPLSSSPSSTAPAMPQMIRKSSQPHPHHHQSSAQQQQYQQHHQQHSHHPVQRSATFHTMTPVTAAAHSASPLISPIHSPTGSADADNQNQSHHAHQPYDAQHSSSIVTMTGYQQHPHHSHTNSLSQPHHSHGHHHTAHLHTLAAPSDGITSITEEKGEECEYDSKDSPASSPVDHPHPAIATMNDTDPHYSTLFNKYKQYSVTALKEQVRSLIHTSSSSTATATTTAESSSALPAGGASVSHQHHEQHSDEMHAMLRGLVEKNDLIDLAIKLTPRESTTTITADNTNIQRTTMNRSRTVEDQRRTSYESQSQSHHVHHDSHSNAPKAFTFNAQNQSLSNPHPHHHHMQQQNSVNHPHQHPHHSHHNNHQHVISPTGSVSSSASSSPVLHPAASISHNTHGQAAASQSHSTTQHGYGSHPHPSTSSQYSPPQLPATDRFSLISPVSTASTSSTSSSTEHSPMAHDVPTPTSDVYSPAVHNHNHQHLLNPPLPHHPLPYKDTNGLTHSSSFDDLTLKKHQQQQQQTSHHMNTSYNPTDMNAFDPLFAEERSHVQDKHAVVGGGGGGSLVYKSSKVESRKKISQ